MTDLTKSIDTVDPVKVACSIAEIYGRISFVRDAYGIENEFFNTAVKDLDDLALKIFDMR